MKPERAWELIAPVAAGVAAAHRQNIIHRDLKPLNIMVQQGVPVNEAVKILDFGLAKIKSGELLGSFVQAQTSGLMGSPFYMAPEQWSDEELDARADIYSLGVILYQMLAGEVPFMGSSIPSIMKKHLTLPPPSFQSMGVAVPPAIEGVVRHALEKEVGDRISSIEAFLTELRGAMSASPVLVATSRPTGSLDPNKTMVSEVSLPPTTQPPNVFSTAVQTPGVSETQFGSSFESMSGTISGSGVIEEVQTAERQREQAEKEPREREEQLARARQQQLAREKEEQLAREKQQQLAREREERPAREKEEQLAREREQQQAREAEARLKAEQEAEQRRRDEQERLRKEQEERVAKEREQQEKLERMAQQAKELEDRLERLAVSIPPPGSEAAQPGAASFPGQTSYPGKNSYPGPS